MHVANNSHWGINVNNICFVFENFFYFGADNFDGKLWEHLSLSGFFQVMIDVKLIFFCH